MTECLYAWGGVAVLGTRDVENALSPWRVMVGERVSAGDVAVTPISSRHIGAAYRNVEHNSFLIEGSRRCLFLGDAAPTQWESSLLKPDVLFAPFVYATTQIGWNIAKGMAPEQLVLLHLPARDSDPERLWQAVERTLSRCQGVCVTIPEIGESIVIA